ncbi:hypothetical protein HGRIS_012121 [Hohenbuehelia grisea]|uniref:Carboxylic ester hydrolase n=1 Tax=Hohenbuehelia grisea TaxID=104357 RepID=A0ABR3IRD0_9AGAR
MPSFLSLVSFCVLAGGAFAQAPVVQLGGTAVTGVYDSCQNTPSSSCLEYFAGLPYAEPPTGNRRLRPPVLKTALSGPTFDATTERPACLQPGLPTSSEDCLTLNIRRPYGVDPSKRLPVVVWFHGGGFRLGRIDLYNGSAIVHQSVQRTMPAIYINFNYRLGPLGFPQGKEADAKGALNLGLKDQLAVLQWIQANIAAFGGDKNKVTVAGQSAGAISIGVHFLRPSFSQLARGAIFHSGSANSHFIRDGSFRQNDWENYVKAVPACQSLASSMSTFDCLRTQDSATLLTAAMAADGQSIEQYPWSPALDGIFGVFPALPSEIFKLGLFARMPFISGTVLDDGTIFSRDVDGAQTIRNNLIVNHTVTNNPVVKTRLERAVDRLMELYPDDPAVGSPYGQTTPLPRHYKRLSSIYTGLLWLAPRRLWSRAATKWGVNVFGYHFTDLYPNRLPHLGVQHGLELIYLFPGHIGLWDADAVLSRRMRDYWISFVSTSNPNNVQGPDAPPAWNKYTLNNPTVMNLNTVGFGNVPDTFNKTQTDFINSRSNIFRR